MLPVFELIIYKKDNLLTKKNKHIAFIARAKQKSRRISISTLPRTLPVKLPLFLLQHAAVKKSKTDLWRQKSSDNTIPVLSLLHFF